MAKYTYTEKIRRLNDERNVRKLLKMVDFPILEPNFFEKGSYEAQINGIEFRLNYTPGGTGMICARTQNDLSLLKKLVLNCIC